MYTLEDLESKRLAVALPTRKKYKAFTEWLENEGRVWRSGELFSGHEEWYNDRSKTALAYWRSAWGVGPADWHKKEGYKMITLLDIDMLTSETSLGDRVEIIEERLGTVTEALDKVLKIIGAEKLETKEPKKDRPEIEESYWLIGNYGEPIKIAWLSDNFDKWRLKSGNCFWGKNAQEACEMYKLRLESMAKAWIPEEGEDYWVADFENKEAFRATSFGVSNMSDAIMGACFEAKEECEGWIETYAKAFEYLTKKK